MLIRKDFKLEYATSKDETRKVLNSVYIRKENESHFAYATNGKILAKVPCKIEDKELALGNSIKADDLKFQRSNPNNKKVDERYCALSPLPEAFPDVDAVMPKGDGIIKIKLDTSLLSDLAKALGRDILTLEIFAEDKAVRVTTIEADSLGLIMPFS